MIKVFIGLAIWLVFLINFETSCHFNAQEMKNKFIDGQCMVGKICANLFYIPAWFLKGIRFIVVSLVK